MHGLNFQDALSLLSLQNLALNGVVAAPADLRGMCRGDLLLRVRTGAVTGGGNGVRADVHRVIHRYQLPAVLAQGATSLVVPDAEGAWYMVGDKIVIENEVVTISAKASAGGNTTLTIGATAASHAAGKYVYVKCATPGSTFTVEPTNGLTANATFGRELAIGNGDYIVVLTNLDGTNAVTVDLALSKL